MMIADDPSWQCPVSFRGTVGNGRQETLPYIIKIMEQRYSYAMIFEKSVNTSTAVILHPLLVRQDQQLCRSVCVAFGKNIYWGASDHGYNFYPPSITVS